MLFCSSEGGYEGAFQITDNALRLNESVGLEDWSSLNGQLAPSDSTLVMNQFNQASIVPDGINFTPPAGSDLSMMSGISNAVVPGSDIGAALSSITAMPGGIGLVTSFFQALFSFVSGAITTTATDMAKNYAVASQATLEGAKTLTQ